MVDGRLPCSIVAQVSMKQQLDQFFSLDCLRVAVSVCSGLHAVPHPITTDTKVVVRLLYKHQNFTILNTTGVPTKGICVVICQLTKLSQGHMETQAPTELTDCCLLCAAGFAGYWCVLLVTNEVEDCLSVVQRSPRLSE